MILKVFKAAVEPPMSELLISSRRMLAMFFKWSIVSLLSSSADRSSTANRCWEGEVIRLIFVQRFDKLAVVQ